MAEPFVWTKSTEILDVEVKVTENERAAARDRIVEAMAGIDQVGALRRLVLGDLDRREGAFRKIIEENMQQASRRRERRALSCQVGYDLRAGDVVLKHPKTSEIMRRRPMVESERQYAERVRRGEAE
jgi:hypothetical protein